MAYRYLESVLVELARHGVIPRDDTPPDFVREHISALYLVEIRSLRRRLLAGQIPKGDYAQRVAELRDRYPVLSLRVELWAKECDD
jgi:hypothetical protein